MKSLEMFKMKGEPMESQKQNQSLEPSEKTSKTIAKAQSHSLQITFFNLVVLTAAILMFM